MPFPGMLHSPSSFEVSKPSLAGISRCVQENSSTPGELSSRSHRYHAAYAAHQALPCSWHRTHNRMLEVACLSLCPFHSLWLPRYCTWGKNGCVPPFTHTVAQLFEDLAL